MTNRLQFFSILFFCKKNRVQFHEIETKIKIAKQQIKIIYLTKQIIDILAKKKRKRKIQLHVHNFYSIGEKRQNFDLEVLRSDTF